MGFDYRLQKIIMFAVTGFIPLFAYILLDYFKVGVVMSIFTAFLLSIFFVFLGHKMTSQNPFVRAIQQRRVLIFDVNSTGICRIYTAQVMESPNNTGIDIKMDTGEVRAFDRSITHLLQAPQKAFMRFIKGKDNNTDGMVEIKLTNEDFKKAAWYSDQLTILFYNSQVGTFVTKPLVSEQEKTMLVEYLTLNESRELRQLNKIFLDLMRHTFDLISERFGKLFGNPIVQILLVGLVLLIVGYAAWQVLPGLLGGSTGAVQGAVSGQIVQPLTKGAPITLIGWF